MKNARGRSKRFVIDSEAHKFGICFFDWSYMANIVKQTPKH